MSLSGWFFWSKISSAIYVWVEITCWSYCLVFKTKPKVLRTLPGFSCWLCDKYGLSAFYYLRTKKQIITNNHQCLEAHTLFNRENRHANTITIFCDKYCDRDKGHKWSKFGKINYLDILWKSLKIIYLNWVLKNGIEVVTHKNTACANSLFR